ncbi:MAG: glucose-1-phosphate adenylyltransferase [Burkholderiales bacterium]|nr:glucose-1-phosphate adenylyltransferase [Burkholderiales bacterium]
MHEDARGAASRGGQDETLRVTSQRQHLPWRAVALVLPGGYGEQVPVRKPQPAAHFGGKFRMVDFALSNCVNSGIRRIGVITQHKSHSLQRHLQRGWASLKSGADDLIELLPTRQRKDSEPGYRGTADAVFQNLAIVDATNAEYVVVIDGDHIYKMNYALMLADHVAKGRECTVACIEVPPDAASASGVMLVNGHAQIIDIGPRLAAPAAAAGERVLAGMGVYIFNAKYLAAELARTLDEPASRHDFASSIVPRAVRGGHATAHPFARSCVGNAPGATPYWRDVGTVDAYWDANIDLTAAHPRLDLYDPHWPIWTHQAQLAPAKFLHDQPDRRGMAVESLVAGGCIVSGSVRRSVLFPAVRVHSYASVEWSVLLPGVEVGRHARLRRVVVERDCTIPAGLVIGEDAVADADRFFRTDKGITLVTAEMLERLSAEPHATA